MRFCLFPSKYVYDSSAEFFFHIVLSLFFFKVVEWPTLFSKSWSSSYLSFFCCCSCECLIVLFWFFSFCLCLLPARVSVDLLVCLYLYASIFSSLFIVMISVTAATAYTPEHILVGSHLFFFFLFESKKQH